MSCREATLSDDSLEYMSEGDARLEDGELEWVPPPARYPHDPVAALVQQPPPPVSVLPTAGHALHVIQHPQDPCQTSCCLTAAYHMQAEAHQAWQAACAPEVAP